MMKAVLSKIVSNNNDMPVLLMAEPTYYAISNPYKGGQAPANDFEVEGYKEYIRDPQAFVDKATRQWKDLKAIFNALGVRTPVIAPARNNPDQVFTADPSLSLRTGRGTLVTIFSSFSNEPRQNEVASHVAFFEGQGADRALVDSHFKTEGTGDNVYDPFRDIFWSGYTETPGRAQSASGRSDQRAHAALKQVTGVDVVSLQVKKPFFHIDTALAPLPTGHIVCYRGGMSDESFEKMQREAFDRFGLDRKQYLIEISEEDARHFACNLRCIRDNIVMPECSQALQDRLTDLGYNVITTAMDSFIKAGGAVHCVTNNINEARIPGGYVRQLRHHP